MRTMVCKSVLLSGVMLSGLSAASADRSSAVSESERNGGDSASYPARSVTLIEPFGAGGGPDVIARAIAPKLAELWGQSVNVENHPGAGSTAAPALVAKSPPDGYTLLLNTSAMAYSAALARNLPYDPLTDFIPIASITSQPYVLVAGRLAGIKNLADLIAVAKSSPGKLRFTSTGIGTGTHLALVKLNLEAGIQAVHVPARASEAITDVIANTIAGRADYMMAPIPLVLSDIGAGRLVALGVSGARRSSLLPQVPTIAAAGVANYDFPIWYGIWAAAGTPARVVEKLARDITRTLGAPDLQASLARHGADPMIMTQPEFARFVKNESERALELARAAGIASQ